MTTLNEARRAAYDRWIAEWGDATPYAFDNEDFAPPDAAPWARVSVRSVSGGQETLGAPGNRKYTRRAIVRVEVYTPPRTGLRDADLLVTRALGIYEGRTLADPAVRTYDCLTAEVGLVDEDRWFLSTAQASFDYSENK